MGRFALGNAVAVAALLMDLPASADDLISHHPELLTPFPDNRWWQATKIAKSAAEYACMEVLHKSVIGEAASNGRKGNDKGARRVRRIPCRRDGRHSRGKIL
jgi:hypothetical protein